MCYKLVKGKKNMVKYILKRLLLSLFILFGVSIIIYTLVRMMPSDYVDIKFEPQILNGQITHEQVAEMKKLYGIGDNSFSGIMSGYFNWVGEMLKGNLGQSFLYMLPVTEVIKQYMGISFAIALVAFILQMIIAIPLGIKAATNQYGVFDYTASVLTVMGISLPSFFFAALLIKVLSFDLGWFPMTGSGESSSIKTWSDLVTVIHHMILPMTVLVVLSLGGLMRYTRTNMLEVLNSDYIRTARAKGLPEKAVIHKHAFRNTLIPLVTMLAGTLPSLFGGAMITEKVFSIAGIGLKAYNAMMIGDIPFIMGYNMFLAVLTVIGTLLSDIAYSFVDPRVKLTK